MNLNIPENEKTPLVKQLIEIINEQSKKIIYLEQELLKLKNKTIRPKIKPSQLNDSDKSKKRKSTKEIKKNKKSIEIHKEKTIQPNNISKTNNFNI